MIRSFTVIFRRFEAISRKTPPGKKFFLGTDPRKSAKPSHLAKRVATILSEELGMPRRGVCNRTRRAVVLYEEPELKALMARYGIQPPVQEAQ